MNTTEASLCQTERALAAAEAEIAALKAERDAAITLLRAVQGHANGRVLASGGNYKRLFEIDQWVVEFLNGGAS